MLKVKKTQQQISPLINVLLFKHFCCNITIIVELDRNKNFESDTIGFQVFDGFQISEKVSDSIGFRLGFRFGTRHIPISGTISAHEDCGQFLLYGASIIM